MPNAGQRLQTPRSVTLIDSNLRSKGSTLSCTRTTSKALNRLPRRRVREQPEIAALLGVEDKVERVGRQAPSLRSLNTPPHDGPDSLQLPSGEDLGARRETVQHERLSSGVRERDDALYATRPAGRCRRCSPAGSRERVRGRRDAGRYEDRGRRGHRAARRRAPLASRAATSRGASRLARSNLERMGASCPRRAPPLFLGVLPPASGAADPAGELSNTGAAHGRRRSRRQP